MERNIIVSTASLVDSEKVLGIGKTTFLETWQHLNSREDMDLYLAEKFSLENIRNELSDSQNQFLIAEMDGEPAGYAKLRTSKTPQELRGRKCIEIERMYVLKVFKSQLIGSRLMQHCLDYAIENQYETIWLGVWNENYPAIRFYSRWGFEWFGFHTFILGNDHQRDELMKRNLDQAPLSTYSDR